MSKRPARGPTDQRKVTLPLHFWSLLEKVADLQTESYVLMGGKTSFTVSDLLQSGAEMYLRDLFQEHGPLPKTADERKEYVRKLADENVKELQLKLQGKSH